MHSDKSYTIDHAQWLKLLLELDETKHRLYLERTENARLRKQLDKLNARVRAFRERLRNVRLDKADVWMYNYQGVRDRLAYLESDAANEPRRKYRLRKQNRVRDLISRLHKIERSVDYDDIW